MSESLEKLKRLLAEMFQLDQTELDFGIYRIMNAKRDEITRFLDKDLLPQVREAFQAYKAENRGAVEAELAEAVEKAKELGADPETLPRVKELRAKLAEAVDVTALENEVYSHLYNFFRRYYQEGDFISLRRYKEGVYAIPYEGEEVKLHWANHDQYYIKTSEYLRDYTFKLPSGKRVHFKLVEADTEKDNNRPQNGNERRFILGRGEGETGRQGDGETGVRRQESGDGNRAIWDFGEDELVIYFRFVPDPEKRKQADLNADAANQLVSLFSQASLSRLLTPDFLPHLAAECPTEKNPKRTLLEKHLTDYTARNTFDYFIHKDLGGFLRRELDFYIKNEVMHLDDIESETAPRVEQYLAKIKAIRRIAHKLIDFLAQIENFQKKLWLKKKFVVETQYCITLDRIFTIENEKTRYWLIDEILKNDAQREEWVRLFSIDEIKGDLTMPGYTEPLTAEFLRAHPTLVVDTRHFDEAFKLRLLVAIPDLDEETNGVLIHSENFQALNLLQARYRGQVKCVYIDPPYNTGTDGFVYRDRYQHSSWLGMIGHRLALAEALLNDLGAIFVSVDDNEQAHLRLLMDDLFGVNNFITSMVWEGGLKNDSRFISVSQDYIVTYVRDKERLVTAGQRWRTRKEGIDEIYKEVEKLKKQHGNDYDAISRALKEWYRHLPKGHPAKTHEHYSCVDARGVYFPDNISWPGGGGPTYEVLHPVTKRPVAIPKRGWVFSKAETMQQAIAEGRIHFGPDESTVPNLKRYLHETEGQVLPAVFYRDRRAAFKELRDILGGDGFANPKDPYILAKLIEACSEKDSLILDYFAGSGTTGHAVINLNREDGGQRKFILVEMGDYFDTVLVPRLKKVIFTPEWKDGKPKRMPTEEEIERSPRILKILRLESYEDTLNNLKLKRTEAQQSLLDQYREFREDYMLRYMLDVESRGSASLLNIDRFEDPFNYKLSIATGTAGETKPTVVDLIETFNYLIGLRVKTIDHIGGVRVVTGMNPQGERVLILWRNTKELDNDELDKWFRKQGYNTKDQEYDVIYVNGDNNLENLRKPDQTWKVRLTEEVFRRFMFDVQDV
ncbi:MAG: site-specific DNA-methyltransferase [Bryobacteraceae bacterium]|nr:site-specific DNA-methyltransferase [Bryobacteraceae bacterium]